MILSSATIDDVNAVYKKTLSQTQQQMMLLSQSIESLLLTRQMREERPKSKGVTLSSVENEINERIKTKKERAQRLHGKFY